MHYSILLSANLMALALASPMPSNDGTITKRSPDKIITLKDGTEVIDRPAHDKRDSSTETITKRSPDEILTLKDGTEVIDRPAHDKRHISLRDGTIVTVSDAYANDTLAARMEKMQKREADKISSCGPKSGWMPIEDHGMHLDQMMWGYRSAVANFCNRVGHGSNDDGSDSPLVVAAGHSNSVTVKWQNDAKDVRDDFRGNRVGLKNNVPGHVECKPYTK
jgi:hypothetical protein